MSSREGEANAFYREAVEAEGYGLDVAGSFPELFQRMVSTEYSGILVDIPSKIRAAQEERERLKPILDRFPYAELNLDPKSGRIRARIPGEVAPKAALNHFLGEVCGAFRPRSIRAHKRSGIKFHVSLSDSPRLDEETSFKTTTTDASRDGCFVFFNGTAALGSRIWMDFKELGGEEPIIGEVKRQVGWGKDAGFPGLGLAFTDMSDLQAQRLAQLV